MSKDMRMARLAYEFLAVEFTAPDTDQSKGDMIAAAGYNRWEVQYFVEDLNKRLRTKGSGMRVRISYKPGSHVPPEGGYLSQVDDLFIEVGKAKRKVRAVWRLDEKRGATPRAVVVDEARHHSAPAPMRPLPPQAHGA